MKKFTCMLILLLFTAAIFAADIKASIEVSNVIVNAGSLTVTIFDSEEAFKKKKPFRRLKLQTGEETITTSVSLPVGEYFFSAFQDINDNGKFDTNFLGFPKESIGIANFDGKSMPGGFEKHKVLINGNNTVVPLAMIQF